MMDVSEIQNQLRQFTIERNWEQYHAETIYNACLEASEHNIGFLDGTHSLQLYSDLIEKLTTPLRTYIGCAEK